MSEQARLMNCGPKMTGREWLNPDANSTSRQHNSNNRRKKQSRGRFKDDRARRYINPRYAGKQDRSNIKKDSAKQDRNLKKIHQQENSLNDSLLKKSDSLTRKLQAKCSLSSPIKSNQDTPAEHTQPEMGFCGNVKTELKFATMPPRDVDILSDSKLSSKERMDVGSEDVVMEDASFRLHLEDAGSEVNVTAKSEEDIRREVDQLYSTLKEYLQVEEKFLPKVMLPARPRTGEVSAGHRDGSVHVLRCLKVWYELPADVLFHAINLLDRFLSKMKVRPCHMSCISVSCMSIAINSYRPQLPSVNTEDLVSISQCKCTVGDVRRMSGVIGEKLDSVCDTVTSLQWLRLMMSLFSYTAQSTHMPPESEMVNRLEILSCDASCCNIRPCELSLVLICTHLDSQLSELRRAGNGAPQNQERLSILSTLVHFAMELQKICQIGDESFYASHQAVVGVLDRYNARQKIQYRQRLVWKVSSRTLRVLRPTDRFTTMLPTIEEQQNSPANGISNTDTRMSSEGSEDEEACEESQDWPRNPMVPVLTCENS